MTSNAEHDHSLANSSEPDMSLKQAIFERRSVRGFLHRPVPMEVLRQVFAWAQRAPSNCNVQPWTTLVASGKLKDWLREKMLERARQGVAANADYAYPGAFQGVFRERQVDCAVQLYNSMGISREDKQRRGEAALRNYELFGAPHVAFFCMPSAFGAAVAVDVGMYAQNLMLAMTAFGIASCAQGTMRNYPDLVREAFGVDEDLKVLFGLSFGYEDPGVAANRTRVGRAPLGENVLFADQAPQRGATT